MVSKISSVVHEKKKRHQWFVACCCCVVVELLVASCCCCCLLLWLCVLYRSSGLGAALNRTNQIARKNAQNNTHTREAHDASFCCVLCVTLFLKIPRYSRYISSVAFQSPFVGAAFTFVVHCLVGVEVSE